MRNDFVRQMLVEMKRDPSIYFLTADLGFNALEPIEKEFPKRFINVGISEQHMIGMASGLAFEGKKVVCYSIASFAVLRPYEAIRDDVCYHDLDVKIVGVGGGYNYGAAGVTHHTIEDFAITRVLPNMKVLAPGYSWEAREATKALMQSGGPAYIRLGKSPGLSLERPGFKFAIGKGFVIREGKDVVLISTGNTLDLACETADLLEKEGNLTAVISMPTIKPIDAPLIRRYAANAKGVFTIEEHSTIGGLGDAVKDVLWASGTNSVFEAFGIPADRFLKDVGDRNYMLRRAGLEASALSRRVQRRLRG